MSSTNCAAQAIFERLWWVCWLADRLTRTHTRNNGCMFPCDVLPACTNEGRNVSMFRGWHIARQGLFGTEGRTARN